MPPSWSNHKGRSETLRCHTAEDKMCGLDFFVTVPRDMYQLNYPDKLGQPSQFINPTTYV